MDWRYLAGMLHGEGCFTVLRHRRRSGGVQYGPRVEIEMTDHAAVAWLHQAFGGRLLRRDMPGRRSSSRLVFTAQPEIRAVCRGVLPYLHGEKAEQVRRLLAFTETQELLRLRRTAAGRRGFDAAEQAVLTQLARGVKELAGGGGAKAWQTTW